MLSKKNFKGVVSPHEFYNCVAKISKKKFVGQRVDPVLFFSWLMNHLAKKIPKTDEGFDPKEFFESTIAVMWCAIARIGACDGRRGRWWAPNRRQWARRQERSVMCLRYPLTLWRCVVCV